VRNHVVGGRRLANGKITPLTETLTATGTSATTTSIAMVRRVNEVYPRAIDLAARGVVALDPLVSPRTRLTDAAQAFAATVGRAGLKAIIAP
jgi:L-iditol 2-dehydrogenase